MLLDWFMCVALVTYAANKVIIAREDLYSNSPILLLVATVLFAIVQLVVSAGGVISILVILLLVKNYYNELSNLRLLLLESVGVIETTIYSIYFSTISRQ